jgi:hypothetical protein
MSQVTCNQCCSVYTMHIFFLNLVFMKLPTPDFCSIKWQESQRVTGEDMRRGSNSLMTGTILFAWRDWGKDEHQTEQLLSEPWFEPRTFQIRNINHSPMTFSIFKNRKLQCLRLHGHPFLHPCFNLLHLVLIPQDETMSLSSWLPPPPQLSQAPSLIKWGSLSLCLTEWDSPSVNECILCSQKVLQY